MNEHYEKLLLSKLRMPVHIDYISKYILKTDMLETREILARLIEEDVVQESSIAKDYYVIKGEQKK